MKSGQNMKTKNTYMNIVLILSAFIFLLLVNSCSNDITPSLYEDQPKGATPVINSLDPAEKALAGITNITITGENFSTVAENNLVFFNSAPAAILSVSTTELIVKAPNIVSKSIVVKIAVHGVELFSNSMSYELVSAISEPFKFKDFEDPYAITTDIDENIYLSFVSTNVGQGVNKLTPTGELSNFAPKGGETFYNGLKYGGNGVLYGVRAVRAVFEITEGNSPATYAVLDNGTAMFDLDFDKDKNIWTGGAGGKLYRVTPDKDIKSFEFEPTVISIRIFNDHLYAAASDDNGDAVWKFPIISSDSLGAATKYFDIEANYPSTSAFAITFSEDGVLYIGTDFENPIIAVNPDLTHEEWYPGVLASPADKFVWGNGENLYYTIGETGTRTIIKVNMGRSGAPDYGRD